MVKDSSVIGISGVTKDVDDKLRAAGVLTVDDLTKSDAAGLSKETTIDRRTLNKVIISAKDRLN